MIVQHTFVALIEHNTVSITADPAQWHFGYDLKFLGLSGYMDMFSSMVVTRHVHAPTLLSCT